jgi:hypothetical protein
VTITVSATVPSIDWAGQPNQLEQIEILRITPSGTTVLASGPSPSGSLSHTMELPDSGLIVRARGRRAAADGPDLLFYTNAVAIR